MQCKSLATAVQRLIRQSNVVSTHDVGLEVSILCALVPTRCFTDKMKNANLLKTMPVEMPSPDGGKDIEGYLVSKDQLPSDVFHYDVKLVARKGSTLQNIIVCAEDLIRPGQAQDTFTKQTMTSAQRRPTALRLDNFPKLDTWEELQVKAAQVERDLKAAEQARGIVEHASAPQEGGVRRVTAGRFGADEAGNTDAPPGDAEAGRTRKRSARGAPTMSAPQQPRKQQPRASGAAVAARKGSGGGGGGAAGSLLLAADDAVAPGPVRSAGEDDENLGIDFKDIINGGNWGRVLRPVAPLASRCSVLL